MKYSSTLVILLLFIASTNNVIASDSTAVKRTSFLSFGFGLTRNNVFGSMVDRNKQFDGNTIRENKFGFTLHADVEKQIGKRVLISSGLHYIQKQVDPMAKSNSIYRDHLKTGYLSLPIQFGVNVLPPQQTFSAMLFVGSYTNFRVVDKSTSGPDRVGFNTPGVSETLGVGLRLSLYSSHNTRFFFQYSYNKDVTDSYVEHLYWNSVENNKKFVYKYTTHTLSMGTQFAL